MNQETIVRQLSSLGIIPVVTLQDTSRAKSIADALQEGGLPAAEITLRTEGALPAISAMRERYPDMLLGAGTILTAREAGEAIRAGADFIVSPGLVPEVISWCLDSEVAVFPGVCTPTEVCAALLMGVRQLKFFPASPFGGVQMVKTLLAVFPEIQLMPTGGITLANATDYLKTEGVICCGGSYIVPPTLLDLGDFPAIARLARDSVSLVQRIRAANHSLNSMTHL